MKKNLIEMFKEAKADGSQESILKLVEAAKEDGGCDGTKAYVLYDLGEDENGWSCHIGGDYEEKEPYGLKLVGYQLLHCPPVMRPSRNK